MGWKVRGGTGVLVTVGVRVVVGLPVGEGVGVIGITVFVAVAESAKLVCIADHVLAACVSAGNRERALVVVPHARMQNDPSNDININPRCRIFKGPPQIMGTKLFG